MTNQLSRILQRWRGLGLISASLCVLAWAGTWALAADDQVATAPAATGPLVVAMDDNYPPYIFRDASGALNGYLVDVWKLWSRKTGVTVDLQASDWDLAKTRMRTHQAAVIDTIFKTPERELTLDFTTAYAQIPVSIYTHNKIGGITNLNNLKGFLVGVKAGDACIDVLHAAGVTTLQSYANYEALVRGALADQVKIFCLDEPPANYLLYRDHAEGVFNKAFLLNTGEFHRAVHKGDERTMALLNKGFAAITADEDRELPNRWMGTGLPTPNYTHYLAYALLVGAMVGLMLLLWGTVLRRQVRQRTAQLDRERQRLQVLLQAIPDLVWMKDVAGVYRFCNPMFERYMGRLAAEIVGKTDFDFVEKDDADRFHRNDAEAIASKHPTINEENVTFADDGHQALLETTKTPIHGAHGELLGVLGVARDITRHKQTEMALQESERRLHTILDSVEAYIYIKDRNYRYQYANRRLRDFYNKTMNDIVGLDDTELFDAQTAAMLRRNDRRVIEQGERVALEEITFGKKKGSRTVNFSVKLPLRDDTGAVYALCGISTDITAQKAVESTLRVAATAFESQEGMLITDADTVILRINQSFADMTGYAAEEVVGQTPKMFVSDRHDNAFYDKLWSMVNASGSWQGEIWDRRKNGDVFPVWMAITAVKGEDGSVTNYVATHTDITDRKTSEEQIRNLAFYDPLTLLPNRRLLTDRLQHALATSSRSRREAALLFIDLDHFKMLNDTLGHDKGDLLLQEVARRITACIREGDTVARLGGDEFVVMLENLSSNNLEAARQAESVGEKVLNALGQPFDLHGREYRSGASIGLTLFNAPENSSEDLMRRADLAMYQAKASGRNNLRFFDPKMQAEVSARAALETDMRTGLEQHQFELHYQPQIDAHGDVTGAECLLRWRHPQRGMVSPAEFIPLAEDTGLILPLGQWVLETGCRQLRTWQDQPDKAQLSLAVNVSARQFHQEDFVQQVMSALHLTGANARQLKLELTESLLVSNVNATIEKMLALKEMGVSFSLDDFGTGYSSLSYLKRLPLDQLKIDQSFVRDILTDSNDATIATMVIALAASLGLAVIAEGVETKAQRDFLAGLGCHAYQGFLFSRALPLAAFEQYLADS